MHLFGESHDYESFAFKSSPGPTSTCAQVVLGESGVGKTALVEGLAARVAAGDCPPALKGAAIIALDMGLLMAGAASWLAQIDR